MVVDSDAFASTFKVSRETLRRLNLYESALRLWQPKINLIANATLDTVWQRHFADSAQLLALVPAGAKSVVDLGSGAGFPGLVLAILLAGAAEDAGQGLSPRVTLVESDGRKCAFLREVARQTGTAVDILSTRIENPETQAKLGKADVITARALAPVDRLLGLAAPLFGDETVGLFLKGRGVSAEIEAARALWAFDVALVGSLTADDANIVVIRKLRNLARA